MSSTLQLCWFLVQCKVIPNYNLFLFDLQVLSKKKYHENIFKLFFPFNSVTLSAPYGLNYSLQIVQIQMSAGHWLNNKFKKDSAAILMTYQKGPVPRQDWPFIFK